MSDTDFDQLAPNSTAPRRRQIVKFEPTRTTGAILQLGSMLLVAASGWATYQSDKATAKLELEQVKKAASDDKASTKESLSDLKVDMKEIQRTMIQMNQTLAVIEAKQPPKGKP